MQLIHLYLRLLRVWLIRFGLLSQIGLNTRLLRGTRFYIVK